MKFTHLNGHNPDSASAKARLEKKRALDMGTVKCKKCGETHKTLYKVNDYPAEYLCVDCKNGKQYRNFRGLTNFAIYHDLRYNIRVNKR